MVRILTSEEIAEAKKSTPYLGRDNLHEHDDCIRIAYQWLDAQEKTKGQLKRSLAIKHIVGLLEPDFSDLSLTTSHCPSGPCVSSR